MDILLAALMILWGNLTGSHADLTMDQLVQASLNSNKPPEQVAANIPTDVGLIPIIKKDPQPEAVKVKGIYSTANTLGVDRFQTLLKLLDDTELNSMVIDIKDDYGNITYDTGNPDLAAYGTTKKIIKDIPEVMATLKEHNIYPIARIVVFKDTILAEKKPEYSFVNANGTVWKNKPKGGSSFVNPYMKEVWDYNIEVAKEAIKVGFKEIQFDYVRFPEGFEKRADTLKYKKDERSRTDAVSEFVKYAKDQITPLGARVSVDIFGYAASVPAAEGIGQDFNKISMNVDVISPMIYPSHYSAGWFNSKVPDAAPYKTIDGAMKDTHKKLESIADLKPIIRPWIQDFTADWVPGHIQYGKHELDEQIRALKENGVDEFLLWNSKNRFTQGVKYN
jgi:hypothetical protein